MKNKIKNGMKINADINGSLNIMRKALLSNHDVRLEPVDAGFVVNPSRIYIQ